MKLVSSEVKCGELIVVGICTNGTYAQKWTTKLCNY